MGKVKNKKEPQPPAEHWKVLVDTFFRFCLKKFNAEPTFGSSGPRDLKAIVTVLKVRAEKSGATWDEKTASNRLWFFLEHAYKDDWLSRNFLLPHLNRFKDKVFLNLISPKKNGNKEQINPDANAEGDFGSL